MSLRIITQIKKEVEESKTKQYSGIKQKKELKFYSLYLPSILKIQRYFRNFLVRKTKYLQKAVLQELTRKQAMHFDLRSLQSQLEDLNLKKQRIKRANISRLVDQEKQNISSNAQSIVRSLVDSADLYSKNIASSKICIDELQNCRQVQMELKTEIKQLELENHCYDQRILTWNEKLKLLREKIIEQMSVKNELESELALYDQSQCEYN